MFPVFHVRAGNVGGAETVVGTVTRTTHGRENWVGDGWIGFLMGGGKLVRGRWHHGGGDLWKFEPDDRNQLNAIQATPEWEILDGYWGERAEIVLDATRRWDKVPFQPRDAIRIHGVTDTDEDSPTRAREFSGAESADDTRCAEVVEGSWDHEHCVICSETLGTGGQSDGYVSSQQTWVCERCYIDFVMRRSLDFIPSV